MKDKCIHSLETVNSEIKYSKAKKIPKDSGQDNT